MVTVKSANETKDPELQSQNSPAYQYCSVMYTVCAWCGRYLGAKDGWSTPGISGAVCSNCETNLGQEQGAVDAQDTAQWSYRVPCAGVKYYGFE